MSARAGWTSGTVNLNRGDIAMIEIGYSEVCVHMRVAGKVMPVQVTTGLHPAAQLLDASGKPYSFPVTLGEAGIYTDSTGQPYAYPAPTVRCGNCGCLGYDASWSIALDWRCDALCPSCVASYDWSDWTHSGNVYQHN